MGLGGETEKVEKGGCLEGTEENSKAPHAKPAYGAPARLFSVAGGEIQMVRSFALCIGMVLFSTAAHAQLEELAKRAGLGNATGLSDSKVASGLKEALRVGANNAVKLTGKTDGYFGNQAIKILMPSNLRPLERGLRAIGFGPKVDEFILSMNRSAEAAAPAAKKIFGDAILAMTFDDARKILSGGDTAATEYFKSKTLLRAVTNDRHALPCAPYSRK